MTNRNIQGLLDRFKRGRVASDDLVSLLSSAMVESIGFAQVDHHREFRQGFPEVILCEGKTPEQVAKIAKRIVEHDSPLLATRATVKHFAAVRKLIRKAKFHATARTITANEHRVKARNAGTVLIVTAGTSDLPVAEEAMVSSRMMGNNTELLADVGVAGIHRILNQNERLRMASAIIVVAGMEGALPSVIGGLVSVPVIAVPTSIGYGASFGGIAALLGMLNSCASGVTVVNIDNGFGAAFAAHRIISLYSTLERGKSGNKARRNR
jgi:pyridinium-3,5-biscarboxylic acid mononucleotide synthase